MGRRTNLRLAQSKPPPGQGFRGFDRQRQSLGLHRLRAAARQATVLPIAQPIRLRFGHLAKQPFLPGLTHNVAAFALAASNAAPTAITIAADQVLIFMTIPPCLLLLCAAKTRTSTAEINQRSFSADGVN